MFYRCIQLFVPFAALNKLVEQTYHGDSSDGSDPGTEEDPRDEILTPDNEDGASGEQKSSSPDQDATANVHKHKERTAEPFVHGRDGDRNSVSEIRKSQPQTTDVVQDEDEETLTDSEDSREAKEGVTSRLKEDDHLTLQRRVHAGEAFMTQLPRDVDKESGRDKSGRKSTIKFSQGHQQQQQKPPQKTEIPATEENKQRSAVQVEAGVTLDVKNQQPDLKRMNEPISRHPDLKQPSQGNVHPGASQMIPGPRKRNGQPPEPMLSQVKEAKEQGHSKTELPQLEPKVSQSSQPKSHRVDLPSISAQKPLHPKAVQNDAVDEQLRKVQPGVPSAQPQSQPGKLPEALQSETGHTGGQLSPTSQPNRAQGSSEDKLPMSHEAKPSADHTITRVERDEHQEKPLVATEWKEMSGLPHAANTATKLTVDDVPVSKDIEGKTQETEVPNKSTIDEETKDLLKTPLELNSLKNQDSKDQIKQQPDLMLEKSSQLPKPHIPVDLKVESSKPKIQIFDSGMSDASGANSDMFGKEILSDAALTDKRQPFSQETDSVMKPPAEPSISDSDKASVESVSFQAANNAADVGLTEEESNIAAKPAAAGTMGPDSSVAANKDGVGPTGKTSCFLSLSFV